MALAKTVETDYGFDVTYWRILTANNDFQAKNCYVEVVGYKDKDTREQSPGSFLTKKQFYISGHEFDTLHEGDLREGIYLHLKQTELEGATDC